MEYCDTFSRHFDKSKSSSRSFTNATVRDTTFTIPWQYENLQFIAYGSQSVLCSATDVENGRTVTIKKLVCPFRNEVRARQVYRELKLLLSVHHQNVIGLLDVFTPQDSVEPFGDLYLVLEFMDATLYKVIELGCDHERMSLLLYQMLCAVKHLASAGIVHRDLKPLNVMVRSDCNLKLIDFGLPRVRQREQQMTAYATTHSYRAPEVILGMKCDSKADIWSIGCIMGEMIRGGKLFPASDYAVHWTMICSCFGGPGERFLAELDERVCKYVAEFSSFKGLPIEKLFPDECFPAASTQYEELNAHAARDLVSKMLVVDPKERISLESALDHPYVKLWCEDDEMNSPPLVPYDDSIESIDLSLPLWKELIYEGVASFGS